MMFDQVFRDWERACEASRQMQQEMFKHWTQPWVSALSNAGGGAEGRAFQKRWMELTIEMLNKQRESLDSAYSSGIQTIEQAFRASEAKSVDEYRRIIEDLWRQMFETFKNQSEAQLRDLQKWAEKSLEFAHKAAA